MSDFSIWALRHSQSFLFFLFQRAFGNVVRRGQFGVLFPSEYGLFLLGITVCLWCAKWRQSCPPSTPRQTFFCTSPCFLRRLRFFHLRGVNDSYNPIDPEKLIPPNPVTWKLGIVMCSTVQYSAGSAALWISIQQHEPVVKAASETVPDCTSTRTRQFFMNPLFVSPVEDGTSFERAAVHVDSADRKQKTKEHFQMSLGEWVSLTSLDCLSFCFPLCLSLSHLALLVLTLRLSWVLLLVCPRTYSSF